MSEVPMYDPFSKSHLASRNYVWGLMWCKEFRFMVDGDGEGNADSPVRGLLTPHVGLRARTGPSTRQLVQ